MALAKCSECGGQVAVTAKACPHCGHRSDSFQPAREAAIWFMITLIAAIIGWVFLTQWLWLIVAIVGGFGILKVLAMLIEGPPKKK